MHKKRLQRLTAVVLAVIMMLSLAAVAGAENTEDIVRGDGAVLEGYRPKEFLEAWLQGTRS